MVPSRIAIPAAVATVALAGIAVYQVTKPSTPEVRVVERQVVVPQEVKHRTLHVEDVPERYRGTFIWDGGTRVQHIALDVEQTKEMNVGEGDTTIVVNGSGTYTTDRVTRIKFHIEIDPDTHRFVMFESEPTTSDFVTAGRHEGVVGDSLDRIEARWIGQDGMEGTTTLWER